MPGTRKLRSFNGNNSSCPEFRRRGFRVAFHTFPQVEIEMGKREKRGGGPIIRFVDGGSLIIAVGETSDPVWGGHLHG